MKNKSIAKRLTALALALLLLTLSACTVAPENPESSTPPSSTPESSVPSSTPESSTPESSVPEASTPESSTPESSVPEASTPEASNESVQKIEAVVMIQNNWNQLRFKNIKEGTLVLKSALGNTTYVEGTDYEVDYENGKIRRLANSRIPDFSNNITYGMPLKSLNHDTVKDATTFHNSYFTAYATYTYDKESNDTYDEILENINSTNATVLPTKLINKIMSGKDVVIGVVGDSISTGAEATSGNEYFTLLKNYLENLGPKKVKVTLYNVSVGGHASNSAYERSNALYQQCGNNQPDLVIIAYGMNDQNTLATTPAQAPNRYVANIKVAINSAIKLKATNDVEIMVVTSMSPNPIWIYSNPDQSQWHNALRTFAKDNGIILADVAAFMKAEMEHGQTVEEIVYSNINHPGNYGHYLYFLTIKSLFE